MRSDAWISMLALAPALAACGAAAPLAQEAPPADRLPAGQEASHVTCNAMSVQSLLGVVANQETGARLLAETGARSLRWAPPRTAMTMDFRPDRLTVGYDDAMRITRISCG